MVVYCGNSQNAEVPGGLKFDIELEILSLALFVVKRGKSPPSTQYTTPPIRPPPSFHAMPVSHSAPSPVTLFFLYNFRESGEGRKKWHFVTNCLSASKPTDCLTPLNDTPPFLQALCNDSPPPPRSLDSLIPSFPVNGGVSSES